MKKVVIFGAGGLGRETINLINLNINRFNPNKYVILGFVVEEKYFKNNDIVDGYPVLGTEKCWDKPLTIYDYPALKDHKLIEPDTIGLKGSPTNIFKSFTPPQKGVGTMLEGDGKDTTDKLAGILAAKHII